jgi:hypothetical protein
MLAGMLFPPRQQRQDHGKLDDLRVSGSQYGVMIPQVYGLGRVAGSLIWVEKDANGNHLRESSRPIRASKGGSRTVGRKYTYSVTMAWLICRGPIEQVRRVWCNDKIIYDVTASPTGPDQYAPTFYLGTESQTVDPDIDAAEAEAWTGYRGMAYAVWEDFPLSEFGSAIPNMSFEVSGIGSEEAAEPLVFYRFEDTPGFLLDSSGNGRTLSQAGSAAVQVAGKVGEALNINGGNDILSTAGAISHFSGSNPYTVKAWVKWNGSSATAVDNFLFLDTATSQHAFNIYIDWLSPQVSHRIDQGSGTTTLTTHSFTRDTNWHFVAVTYDHGHNRARLYWDGVLVDSTAATQSLSWTQGAGTTRFRFSNTFLNQGYWDEVEVLPIELTAAEIESCYNLGPELPQVSVATILANLFGQVGLSASEYLLTAAEAKFVTGYVLGSRVDVRQAVRELLMLTDLDLAEVDGKIVAVARGGAGVATLSEGELGAYVAEPGLEVSEPPSLLEWKRIPGSELPYRLDLEYLSLVLDYQQGQATATRYARVAETQEQLTVSTPLVLSEAQARQAAEKLLYQQWWERQQAVAVVGPKYLFLAPGDPILVPGPDDLIRVRIEQADVDPFGVIRLTLAQDAAEILTQVLEGPTLEAPFAGLTESDETLAVAWVGNALIDAHAVAGDIGFYIAAGGPLEEDWPGATLFVSRDGGVTYTELGSLEDNATLGNADTVLAAPASYDLWDDTNVVDVEITSGEAPETSSDMAVLNGANAAILGDEVIQFVTATSLGSNVYRLSRLLRGRRGTESYGGSHLVGDRFALLEDGRVKRIPVDFALLNKTIYLKAVTTGTTVAAATAISLDVLGRELLPYAVAHVTGTRDGSNNLTIAFERRARAGGAWADLVDVQQPEGTLAFELDVMSGPTVLRTITTNTESATYTAAEQTTDGLTPGNPVTVNIYQIGQIGRGYVKTATV